MFYACRYKGDEGSADWRHVKAGGHDGHIGKWWKKSSNRFATISIFPAANGIVQGSFFKMLYMVVNLLMYCELFICALYLLVNTYIRTFVFAECLVARIKEDGLGPCKEASQAEQGTIEIEFPALDNAADRQLAIIGITADSQRHTRVKLICTELDGAIKFYTVSPSRSLLLKKISVMKKTRQRQIKLLFSFFSICVLLTRFKFCVVSFLTEILFLCRTSYSKLAKSTVWGVPQEPK